MGLSFLVGVAGLSSAFGDGDIHKVNHVIVIMQGGHSFDNYFGALAYVPSGPYHNGNGACEPSDHSCVDGLSCAPDGLGGINCTNQNPNVDGTTAFAFHPGLRCVVPALDPSWFHTHLELNFLHPNRASAPLNDGFLLANTLMGQAGSGLENATPNGAMAFYNQNDLPFYYDLAQKFAIEDRYFASVAGPSFPNRSYLLAATSFGHLTSNDALPPPGGYKPMTGTIFDLLNLNGISWANYFQDGPQGSSFLPFSQTWVDPHFLPLATFMAQAAGSSGVEDLPQVSFVDPNFGLAGIARSGFSPRLHLPTGVHLPRGAAEGTKFQLPAYARDLPRVPGAVPEPDDSGRRLGRSHGQCRCPRSRRTPNPGAREP
jgi:phospholipase C